MNRTETWLQGKIGASQRAKLKDENHVERKHKHEQKVMKRQKAKEKPFCKSYRNFFYKTNNFTRHMREVHGEELFRDYSKCMESLSMRPYKHRRNLRKHLRSNHQKTNSEIDSLILSVEMVPVPNKGEIHFIFSDSIMN